MLGVYFSGILIIVGVLALLAQPVVGVVMIGAGYWLYQRAKAADRYQAASLFWGMCLVAMLVASAAALLSLAG